ncbi:MAG: MotA/TolQ/ExbB proton channel family protein [Magnetococcales bacterium]|nr:MotA/TolQ/ExbB proton channel family protein [Magnetococcales bacterium]MBF0584137.1 MotA/TolQ/ExbB proton channel family protein [Magnetococcales bacterium]
MDLATVIGLVGGFALILWAILMGGQLKMFIDIPSVLIVFGGTLAAIFVKFRLGEVFSTATVIMKAFFNTRPEVDRVIGQLVDMANIARKDGILALEKIKSEDVFMQSAINHCVDGADPEFLETVLGKDLEYLIQRHQRSISVLDSMAEFGPAFGMVGTLIGLVQMLANMSDPNTIGPAMAVALITTLYGAILANLVCIPLAGKLTFYSEDERLVRQVIIDGMVGIQKGVNPRMLQEALKAAIPPKQREAV